ncbi:EAL domain-containing protein [Undibacterium sp. Jales W-56]|uniref:putative bifunctional diguanylate cyclase/phosphodiesterase n=1 Tax=Undibacterium sp. Jales W-56 TaxID=2897325 RepID=UPI0021CDF01F|nr:EAL domain-containing protein [Undibacterium sp. Jales W-56]MCU6434046.1 EAL domain-containing protein [Undibacterium sp. Jales W-56]
MRLHSLQSRVVTLFIVLILAVQLAGFFAIRNAIDSNARAAIREELKISEKIFGHLLEQNKQKLTEGARVLASEFAFREAIATNDTETIVSALDNLGNRFGASFSMLLRLDRTTAASTNNSLTDNTASALLPLFVQAEQSDNGSASSTAIVEGHPYQLVMISVKAPVRIAWVVMAIPIDQKIVADMRELSAMQVSLLTSKSDGNWKPGVSTLNREQVEQLAQIVPRISDKSQLIADLKIGDEDYSARVLKLAQNAELMTVAVLQISVSEAIAPYKKLQRNLLILTVLGVFIASVISVLTTKRITGPMRQLADTAKRLGAGDYTAAITVKRNDEIGDLAQTFATMRDGIANREKEIRRLAYWDTLTNLPNRALFVSMLQDAIKQAQAKEQACFVLMMDLDRFKHVNDVMGHSFGDQLLKQVALRLSNELGQGATKPARLGGDEFAVLLPNSSLKEAQELATRILQSLEKPISIEDQTVDLGAGIGIAGFPDNANDAESLLSRAEVAMYAAKHANSGAVTYMPEIDKTSQQSLSLLSELRTALEQENFRLYVQPKVALDSGKVIAVEALIRWIHPERGFIYPDQFIPFAEQTGFIRQLTRWVLNEAARVCSSWIADGHQLKMSVNLSTRDLMDQDLPNKFADILERHHITPAAFCLEITESAIMDDPVRAQNTLERLHAMGTDLSIDDFGTGYSSLAYLKSLPVDELKIDKSFVLKMEQDIDDTKIVKSTIDLGHNMGLRVVAEGVENKEVMSLLKEMGCDQAQGYYISKPMPSDQFLTWLHIWESAQS